MSEVDKIPVAQAAREIGYKDMRAFKRWCEKHGVTILDNLKPHHVVRVQFELAKDKKLIQVLKDKYGDKWEEHYEALKHGQAGQIIALTTEQKKPEILHGYSPKSARAKRLMGNNKAS